MQALSIGSVTGHHHGHAAFFVANRCLLASAHLAFFDREQLELWLFFSSWLLCFGHAALRGRKAWAQQSAAIRGSALAAVILQWATPGKHTQPVIAVDLALLCTAAVALLSARRLQLLPQLEQAA